MRVLSFYGQKQHPDKTKNSKNLGKVSHDLFNVHSSPKRKRREKKKSFAVFLKRKERERLNSYLSPKNRFKKSENIKNKIFVAFFF